MRFSQISKIITLSLLLALVASLAYAQTSSGTIAGVVTDQTDAVVVGATVVAKSTQTGQTVTAATSGSGAYRIEGLLPGTYTVTISAKGFVTTKVPDLDVRASIVTSLNPSLKLGASETVSVEAQSVALSTESGEVSASIGVKEIQNLPISSLNPYSLALTLPGVTSVESAKMTNGSEFSVNGSRPRANNFLLEGQDNNDQGIHGQGITPNNLEAIDEVAVLMNSYSAEFGHGGGAVSNLVLKRGTNNFHGALWNRILNSSLDSQDKQDAYYGSEKAKYRENTYGFRIGGPILKDRLFFFSSYQWDKYRTTANAGQLRVPTEAGVQTLRGLESNPRIDAYLQAIGSLRGQTDTDFEELGEGRPAVEFGLTQRTGLANLANNDEFDATGDYLFSKNDTLHLRYIRTSGEIPYDIDNFPDQFAGFDSEQYGTSHNAGFAETHTFSPNVINEFRFSYGRIGYTFALRPETLENPLAMGPYISIDGITGFGVDSALPQGRFQNTYQLQDALSISKGNHFFKVGIDISDIRARDLIPFNGRGTIAYNATGDYPGGPSYTGLANYIDDISGWGAGVDRTFGNPILRPDMGTQNYYVHDTWKVLPNLTLNLGLRYEYWGTPANILPYPSVDVNDLECFPCKVDQVADKNNWAPRFGFAYTPRFWEGLFGQGKTVINGGFGVFYDGLFTNITNNTGSTSPNAISPTHTSSTPDIRYADPYTRGEENWSARFASLQPIMTATDDINSIVSNLRAPRTMQWNLRVERELPAKLLATLGYVGSKGDGLFGNNQYNAVDVNTGERRIPTRGRIVLRDNSGSSSYHGMNAQLEKRLSHGLLANVAYTWSKMMDDTSEIFTEGNWSSYPHVQYPSDRHTTDWARSAFDHTHRIAISYVWELPKWNTADEGALPFKYLVNGWQISGTTSIQSGNPVNVFMGYDINGDDIWNDRPNVANPNAPIGSYGVDGAFWFEDIPAGTVCDGYYWWNTNDDCHPVSTDSVHWMIPNLGETGNAGRNSLTSPWTKNWDFALQRTFTITENHKLDFRAEMFNIFNQGNPDLSLLRLSLFDDAPVAFADYDLTKSGHRNIKFFLKYSF